MARKQSTSTRAHTSKKSVEVTIGSHATLSGPSEYLGEGASTCLVALAAALLAAPPESEPTIEAAFYAAAELEGVSEEGATHMLFSLMLTDHEEEHDFDDLTAIGAFGRVYLVSSVSPTSGGANVTV